MSKKKVAIIVDSTCDLPPAYIEQYDLTIIPLIINWEGESLYDGRDITNEQFYQRLATAKQMPSTSQPSAGEFLELYEQLSASAESILVITISGELSGTNDSARTARDMMPDFPIEIVDSRQASVGLGFVALAAARAVETGASAAEAAKIAREIIKQVQIIFVVDTLEFLHRGGRIGGARRFIGSVLSIKPILGLVGDDGTVQALGSVRTKKKAIKEMVEMVRKEWTGKTELHLALLSTDSNVDVETLSKELIAEFSPIEQINITLSPVLGTHVGPGAVGIAGYALK